MDLITFLKTHTKISNEFIDDFFSLYDTENTKQCSINIEAVAKWFNINKAHVKKTLKNSYKLNTDYTITLEKTVGKVGKPKEIILITPKCFKLMAMQSRTKKASTVREYYYELEQFIDQYKNYIIEGLKSKIEKLENNAKPKVNPSKGIIYVIEASDSIGHYKIGRTKDLKKRLNGYNGDKKNDIIPAFIYETDDIENVELCVKRYAKEFQCRKYKEIYKINIDLLKELISDCGEFNKNTRLKMKWKNLSADKNIYVAMYRNR